MREGFGPEISILRSWGEMGGYRPDFRVKVPNLRAPTTIACSISSDWCFSSIIRLRASTFEGRQAGGILMKRAGCDRVLRRNRFPWKELTHVIGMPVARP